MAGSRKPPGHARSPVPAPPRKDPLTGLFQQDHLSQQLTALLRRQQSTPVVASLALLQLANFYEIRRWVGKSEANLLLSDIARLLAKSLPRSVLLCRCAHYEFAALFRDADSVNAQPLIQRLKQALQSAVSESIPPQLELKCSVGVAPLARNVPSADVLLARARHDLSLALSRQRRHTFDTHHGATHTMSRARLVQALQQHALTLNFQALASLEVDGRHHYEVRCQLPDAALTPPAALFATAVHNALGERIDRWVIKQCLQQLRQTADTQLCLTVNLTQNSLVSPHFPAWLRSQLEPYPALGRKLVFQISELDLLTTQHHIQHFNRHLGELQIRLCISQFGCTPDPFRYLPLLQAHYVKLDESQLENVLVDQQAQARLTATTARLHKRGLRVIAAMVEDMRLLPLLWDADVHLVQGICLHEPAPDKSFAFLARRRLDLAQPDLAGRTN